MNIVSFIVFLMLVLSVALFILWFIKRKDKKHRFVLLAIPFFLLLAFASTYIPHQILSIDPSSVSAITVFDGNTGNAVDITDAAQINRIIDNLNETTFQKGKLSFGYTGYSFRTTILDDHGKKLEELIINSESTIRYKGFFYTSKDKPIEYDYIEELVRK